MSEAEAPSEPRAAAAPPYSPGGRRVLAAVANIFAPGAGQLVLGRTRRALVVFAGIAVGAALLPYWPYAFFVWGGVWVASIIDSGITRPLRYPSTGRVVGIIILTFFGNWMFRSLEVRYYAEAFDIQDNGMAPTFRRGDSVFARKGAETTLGHVVVYKDPCHDGKRKFGRIIARGGDAVEIRCGTLYVNGTEVPHREATGDCSYYIPEKDHGWRAQSCQPMSETVAGIEHRLAHLPDVPASAHDFPPVDANAAAPACPPERIAGEEAKDAPAPPPAPPPAPAACRPTRDFSVPQGALFILGDNRDDAVNSRTFGPIPAGSILGEVRTIWWSTAPSRGAQWDRLTRVR